MKIRTILNRAKSNESLILIDCFIYKLSMIVASFLSTVQSNLAENIMSQNSISNKPI